MWWALAHRQDLLVGTSLAAADLDDRAWGALGKEGLTRSLRSLFPLLVALHREDLPLWSWVHSKHLLLVVLVLEVHLDSLRVALDMEGLIHA